MCHLILMMPLLGLAVFWFLPLPVATAIYSAITVASLWLYWLAMRAMRAPVETGAEALLHARGTVIDAAETLACVRLQGGELWNAESVERLEPGDAVEVVGVEGLRLKVRRTAEAVSRPRERRPAGGGRADE